MSNHKRNPNWTGQELLKARINSGLTQDAVAERLGVAQPTISTWEKGKSTPSKEQMTKLEAFLGPLGTQKGDTDSDTSTETSAFGVWVNSVRSKKGWTVVELAAKAGVSAPTIYNLENGRIDNPQEKTRTRIVTALGVTPESEIVAETKRAAQIEGLGNLEDFDPYDPEDLPEGSGVYVFYDIAQHPLYVGESQDLAKRLKDYSDKYWFKRPIVESGSFVKIAEKKLRKQVEQLLIRFLKSNAVLNKQHVDRND
jgi:transcriptional regulator with XRE-family HTH domain